METEKSKVYVLPDAKGRITRIDGGYTLSNIKNIDKWVLIDEGYGDRYNLCQCNYLDKSIMDERGIYRYKLINNKPVERTVEEMDADYAARPAPEPTAEEKEKTLLKAQIQALSDRNDFLEDCVAEMASVVYA